MGRGLQHVASGLHRGNGSELRQWRRAGLTCAWSGQADESRGALWGERKKFSVRRGRTTLREPLQSHFFILCLLNAFLSIFFDFLGVYKHCYCARERERSPTFRLKSTAPWSCSASKWTPSYVLVPIRTSCAMTGCYRACWPSRRGFYRNIPISKASRKTFSPLWGGWSRRGCWRFVPETMSADKSYSFRARLLKAPDCVVAPCTERTLQFCRVYQTPGSHYMPAIPHNNQVCRFVSFFKSPLMVTAFWGRLQPVVSATPESFFQTARRLLRKSSLLILKCYYFR